jgi:hypothetical protein
MTDRQLNQPSPHEREVVEERQEFPGEEGPEAMTGEAPGEVGTTPYEAEVEAERRGTTAEEVAGDVGEDEAQPLDAGYRPKSG